jgi:hypothetical protein
MKKLSKTFKNLKDAMLLKDVTKAVNTFNSSMKDLATDELNLLKSIQEKGKRLYRENPELFVHGAVSMEAKEYWYWKFKNEKYAV